MNVIPATSEVSRYKVAKALLFEGLTMVHVVRGRKGVELPSVCNTPVVHLNFSYRFGMSAFEVDPLSIPQKAMLFRKKAMIRTTKTTNRMHTDRFDSFDRATCNTGGLCFGAHVQGISLRSHRFGRIKGRRV
mgnify:CR=1 FL=1